MFFNNEKVKNLFIFFFFIFLLGCTKSKTTTVDTTNDNITKLITLGSDKKLTYEKRIKYTNKALELLSKQENDSLNREHIYQIGWNFYYMNNLIKFKYISNILLNKSIKKNNINHIAKSYRLLGLYYEKSSINDSAFYYYSKAGKLFLQLNDQKELCKNFQDKSYVQAYVNDYLGSDKSLIEALKIAKKNKFEVEEFKIYNLIGSNSYLNNDFKNALIYFKKARLFFNKNNLELVNEVNILNTEACIGDVNLKINKYNKAILIYKSILNNNNFLEKEPTNYCYVLDNLAKSKLKIKNYRGIESLHLLALKIRDSLNIYEGKQYGKLCLSEYYYATKKFTKAKECAQESFMLSKRFKSVDDILLSLKQLILVDPKNDLYYANEYIKLSDSIQQVERRAKDKFARIAYETNEITTEKEIAVHQKWIYFWIAMIVFLFSSLLVIIILQRNKQKALLFMQEQQKSNEKIFQLIQNQQAKIEEVRQQEKKRIAEELHDGIMNRLVSTRLNLHILNENSDKETIKKCLPFIAGIQDIEREIRNIAHDFNIDIFSDSDSFKSIIILLFEEQQKLYSAVCSLNIDPTINWDELVTIKKIHLYRILQESLQNINKYAKAKHINVIFEKSNNTINLTITDDGIGFDVDSKKKGIGIQNMIARTKECKGFIEIKSINDIGTTVSVSVPIKKNKKENQ